MITFEEMGLSPGLLKAINELGYIRPTPIQDKTIPTLLKSGKDLVGLAQTGTGKTAAFGLPLINQTDIASSDVQSLVLCPTRELCVQIAKDIEQYSKYTKGFHAVPVYGGANIQVQIKALKKGCQMVVGTPGRMLDLIKRKVLKISKIKWLVLDEADEMLNMGFKEELDTILAETPAEKQTLLFSATMPKEITSIAKKYMTDPLEISVGKRNTGAENVNHIFFVVQARNRYEVLKRIADINPKIYGIVFCRTRNETKDVADKLISDGYNADALHGDLSQAQRDHVMNRFRQKHLQILVATDVAARGLDVNDLSHVINYNLPDELEIYIHRSGRTGRAGKKGISISIVHTRETRKINSLEKLTGKPFERMMVPGGTEICEKQLFNLIDKVEKVKVEDAHIDQFLPVIYKKLEWLDREELIKHFVSVEFNRFLAYYKDAPDLNIETSEKQIRKQKKGRSTTEFERFFINLGSKHKMNPSRLIGLINETTRERNIEIGRIDIKKSFGFFEIDKQFSNDLQKSFSKVNFEGVKVVVQPSKPDPNAKPSTSTKDGSYTRKKKKSKFKKKYS